MFSEKILRPQLGSIGEQRNPAKVLLLGEADRVVEQHRTVTVPAIFLMNHQVLQKNNKTTFRRADGKQQVDHPDDRLVSTQNKHPSAIRLLEDQTQAPQLFVFVR